MRQSSNTRGRFERRFAIVSGTWWTIIVATVSHLQNCVVGFGITNHPYGHTALNSALEENSLVGRKKHHRRKRRERHHLRGAKGRRRVDETDGDLSVEEALDSLPLGVAQMYHSLKSGSGDSAKIMEELNTVYRSSMDSLDVSVFECVHRSAQSVQELHDARSEFRRSEQAVTQTQDRINNLQSGVDRALVEVEALENEFQRHKLLCDTSRQQEKNALHLLEKDKTTSKALVKASTQTCSFGGGTVPALVECSLPDGSHIVAFEDETLRATSGNLSAISERLLALELKRCVRRSMAHHVQSQSSSFSQQRITVARHRRLLRRRRMPANTCTKTQAPSCQCFLDNLASFTGGVQDLTDEVRAKRQVETERCKATLDRYAKTIEDLKKQPETAGVELANLVMHLGQLQASVSQHRSQVRDLESEVAHEQEHCKKLHEDATASMCSATRLVKELSADGSGSAFVGDCEVTDWLSGECSKPCGLGGGIENISRRVISAPETNALCPPVNGMRICNAFPCPVDGMMTAWQEWSACTQECGGGTRSRRRTVSRQPSHGGRPNGETLQVEVCNVHACDQDCVLSEWSLWSACSRMCSGGHQVRHRYVLQQPFGNGECWDEDSPHRRESAGCNGQGCQNATALKCASQLDVVFALDGSGSIEQTGFDNFQEFIKAVVARVNFGTTANTSQVGFVQFSDKDQSTQVLTSKQDEFVASFDKLSYAPDVTNMAEGLARAGAAFEAGRAGVKQVVAVITDGVPTSAYLLASEADRLRRRGVRLLFVLVGPSGNKKAAFHWASWPPQENVVMVPSFVHLSRSSVVTSFLAALCPDLV